MLDYPDPPGEGGESGNQGRPGMLVVQGLRDEEWTGHSSSVYGGLGSSECWDNR